MLREAGAVLKESDTYREWAPPEAWREVVACCWEQHVGADRVQRVLPDGHADVLLYGSGEVELVGVYDHVVRVTDEIDTLRDLVSNIVDANLAAVSNRLNEVMKVLTAVATILFVMTIVTSFFGQNFVAFIPYDSAVVFWGSIAFTVVSAAALAIFFRRKGWL